MMLPVNSDLYAHMLSRWPYQSGKVLARVVSGENDVERLQVRVELGILQMEVVGHPEGAIPIYESMKQTPEALDESTCLALQREAALYAYRAFILSVLERHAGVVKDMARNLAVMSMIIDSANSDVDRGRARSLTVQFLMIRARSRAAFAASKGDFSLARRTLESDMKEIRDALRQAGRASDVENAPEIQLLKGMQDMYVPRLPSSQRQEMEERLAAAIDVENYELAAILRNELRQLF